MVRTGTTSGVILVKGVLAIGEWKWGLWKVLGSGVLSFNGGWKVFERKRVRVMRKTNELVMKNLIMIRLKGKSCG